MKIFIRQMISTVIMTLALVISLGVHASSLESTVSAGILYLPDNDSTSLVRYSLADQTFLAPITLAQKPWAVHVDESGIYVSYGSQIVKLALDGTGETAYRSVSENILDIESTEDFLFLAGYNYLQTVNKAAGTLADSKGLWYTSPHININQNKTGVFTTSAGISPADIYYISVSASGVIGNTIESPYHGDYNIGSNPINFPTQNRVVDSSGNVYNTSDLTFAGNLGGFYTSIDFWQGLPIVLRQGKLYSYNGAMLETGNYTLANADAFLIRVYEDQVLAFSLDNSNQLVVEVVAVNLISPAEPGAPIDPTDLAYTPDAIALDKDQDTVYLLSKAQQNIFRWSISQEKYIESIPLANAPIAMAYSAAHERIYLSYLNGAINYVSLSTGLETPFANIGSGSYAMTAAGNFLVAKGDTGAWGSFSVYNAQGERTDYRDWIEPTYFIAWDKHLNAIYYISNYSPSDLHRVLLNDEGKLGFYIDSPYHDSSGWSDPIRISETGKYISLATGWVVDQSSLLKIAEVNSGNYLKDTAWLNGNLYTLKGVDSNTYSQVERWRANFTSDPGALVEYSGAPVGLVAAAASDSLVTIYLQNGIPHFVVNHFTEEDFDNDGVMDSEDVFPTDASEHADFDGDGLGDIADTDDDNDEVIDTLDAFPNNASEWLDSDGDGTGDNADPDDDNDNVLDDEDMFPFDASEWNDLDLDGVGDNSDPDRDGDGVPNGQDAFPDNGGEWLDSDGDGTGNNADLDDDNDTVPDTLDFYPNDATKSALQAQDFLPLVKGNLWYYDNSGVAAKIGAEKTIANEKILPIEFPGGSRTYLKVVNNKIQFFGFYLPSLYTDYGQFATDFTLNKGVDLTVSNTQSGVGSVSISPKYGKKNLNWTVSVTKYGSESIVVPAGQYATFHTRINFSGTAVVDGTQLRVDYGVDYWFAEDIGLVKIEEDYAYPISLVSASVTKPSGNTSTDSGNSSGGSSGGGGSSNFLLLALLALLSIGQLKVVRRH